MASIKLSAPNDIRVIQIRTIRLFLNHLGFISSPQTPFTLWSKNWPIFCFSLIIALIRQFRGNFSHTNIPIGIWANDLHCWNAVKWAQSLFWNCSKINHQRSFEKNEFRKLQDGSTQRHLVYPYRSVCCIF